MVLHKKIKDLQSVKLLHTTIHGSLKQSHRILDYNLTVPILEEEKNGAIALLHTCYVLIYSNLFFCEKARWTWTDVAIS